MVVMVALKWSPPSIHPREVLCLHIEVSSFLVELHIVSMKATLYTNM